MKQRTARIRRPSTWAERVAATEDHIRSSLILHRDRVRCRCGAAASDLHLLPWAERHAEVVPACPAHDWGGYFIGVDDLVKDWADWKRHLHGKREGEAAWRQLLVWLARVTA